MSDKLLEVKINDFSLFCSEMSQRLGDAAPIRRVIDYEVSKVLQRAVALTGNATVNKIRSRYESKKWTTYNGKRYDLSWKDPDSVWAGIESKRNANLSRRIAARGLSARSWVDLGEQLGFDIKAPGYVKAARTPKDPKNTTVTRSESSGSYGVELLNNMPILRFNPPGGAAALFTAISGRVNFFKRNVATGVFNTVESVAKKYPGLLTASDEPAPLTD